MNETVKENAYKFLQPATLLWKLACHIESNSVTCHRADVTFLLLPQPVKDVFSLIPRPIVLYIYLVFSFDNLTF